jgi:CRP-like cAMP-binding protein
LTLDILRDSRLLRGADPGLLSELARFCAPIQAAPGYTFFEQGEPGTGMYWVGDGAVELHMQVVGSETRLMRTAGPGDAFGELALMDGEGRAATARARGRVRVAMLHETAYRALLTTGNEVALFMLQALNQQIDERFRDVLAAVVAHPAPTLARGPGWERRRVCALDRPPPGSAASLLAHLNLPADVPASLLLGHARLEGHARGAVLAVEGEPANEIFVVLRGALRTSVARAGRLGQILIAGPGAWVGADGVLAGRVRAVSIDVREDAWILRVDAAAVAGMGGPGGAAFARACGVALARDLRLLNRHRSRLETMVEPEGVVPCAG